MNENWKINILPTKSVCVCVCVCGGGGVEVGGWGCVGGGGLHMVDQILSWSIIYFADHRCVALSVQADELAGINVSWDSAVFWYSRPPLIRINWDDEPSGYAENLDNWIFFCK